LRLLATIAVIAATAVGYVTAAEHRVLERIARCESHGDPRAISPHGTYRGKYQFAFSTWRSVGGRGDPARASAAEQEWRAALLLRRDGRHPWPVCGYR